MFKKKWFWNPMFWKSGLWPLPGLTFQINSTLPKFQLFIRFRTHFPTLSKISNQVSKEFFSLILTYRTCFHFRFFANFNHFSRIVKMKYGHFWDVSEIWFWNRKFWKSWSGTTNKPCFSNQLIRICIPKFFVDFLTTLSKAQFFLLRKFWSGRKSPNTHKITQRDILVDFELQKLFFLTF